MFKTAHAMVAVGAMVLAGCAVQPENAFPEAATPQQCFAAFRQGEANNRRAEANASYGSSNALGTSIGVSIGRGINESVNNNRYALCLQRTGATEADLRQIEAQVGVAPRAFTARQSSVGFSGTTGARELGTGGCPSGVTGMYGGNGYCF